MVIKISIGKLQFKTDIDDIMNIVIQSGFKFLNIKPEHAIKLIELDNIHRDPFDQMLIAQSLVGPLHLVTCDSELTKYKASVI